MGKHQSGSSKFEAPRPDTTGAYMRGIGCLMMIIVPVFSYVLGMEMAKKRIGFGIIPEKWYGYMEFPDSFIDSGLAPVFNYLGGIQSLPAILVFAVLGTLLLGGIISILYGYIYQMATPNRYGPMDVPPPRVKTKKYKR